MNALRRIPWDLLGGAVIGIVLGLVYAWLISPVKYVDSTPDALRADFKDGYRALVASAYLADGDLERARARLAALADPDPAAALTSQANALLAAGDPQGSAYALLQLARALQPPTAVTVIATPPLLISPAANLPTEAGLVTDTPGGPPTDTPSMSDTPVVTDTATAAFTPFVTATPRPTRTPTPTPGLPYALAERQTVCDANLADALIRVHVRDAAGNPIPGAEILVWWDGGRERIFTGLKPELGAGYADFVMTPSILYHVQVAGGGAIAADLEAPVCEAAGVTWWGSILLVFQQP